MRTALKVGVPIQPVVSIGGAAVTLNEDAEATPDELSDYLKQRVAAYNYARVVWIVDELPKGPTGKVLKARDQDPGDSQGGVGAPRGFKRSASASAVALALSRASA